MKKLKILFRVVFGRTAFVILFLLIQIAILFSCFRWLAEYMFLVYGGMVALTIGLVVYILNKREDASFKLAWIVPVLVIPVFGSLFYLFVELQIGTKMIGKRLSQLIDETKPYLKQDTKVSASLGKEDALAAGFCNYMNARGGYPTYQNTGVKYLPMGEDKYEQMLIELKKAKEFIFLEYFIVEHGLMWDSILEVLAAKVKEGVEVRMMYDGMCSIILLPYSYPQKLEAMGIKCKMFSPIKPALSTHQNNRDHRKILVIDGNTAFTGGVNLADEYINQVKKFGHWKDTAVMLKGDAVDCFTVMFLQMWNITERQPENYKRYLNKGRDSDFDSLPHDGFVMPYGDSPLDSENVGEQVYMDILNCASKYVHIMTPYLILDDNMINALCYSAKRGVDTVIMMPHIPDKKYAFVLARAHYGELIDAGVKIYEYTPGFVHAKVFVSDDERAVVGTINLDYRSLYLHFECAAYIYRNSVIPEIEEDFQRTLTVCERITQKECREFPLMDKLMGRVFRLFAPLM